MLVYHKSIEYGLRLIALDIVGIIILPIIYFLCRPLFRWLDELEDKLRNAISSKRE